MWTAAPALAADRVVFQDGSALEGTVESESETEVVLRVRGELRRCPRGIVRSVVLDPLLHPAPAEAPAAAGTPERGAKPKPAGDGGAAPAKDGTPAPGSPSEKAAPGSDAPAAPAAAAAGTKTTVDWLVLGKIADGTPAECGAALEIIAAGWPLTRPTVEAALRHPSSHIRLAVVGLIDDERMSGAAAYLTDLLTDQAPAVRRMAARMVRRVPLARFEPDLVERLVSDRDTGVRAEALRSLEDVGTAACLRAVLRTMETEQNEVLRPRLIRVLRKLTGEDGRGDLEAWRAAVDRAVQRAADAKRSPPK